MTAQIERLDEQELQAEDVGNIMLLEHVNVQIDDQAKATLFYLVGLGLTRDPHMMVGLDNMWVNLGEQQFHLPTNQHVNVLRGHIGLVTPGLDALAARLERVAPQLEGTRFAWTRHADRIEATCPWGNRFRITEPSEESGGIVSGIPYVEFTIPPGAAGGIARFYREVMGCRAEVLDEDGPVTEVAVGQYQRLRFREVDQVPPYDGHHIAIYVADFSGPCRWLADRGLLTEAPRNHQFRFVDIVDPDSGEQLFQIEHEVRSLKHALYRRELVTRRAGQFLEPRRVNGTTVMA